MLPAKVLPVDVWIWIIKNYIRGAEIASVASTDKMLRDLALSRLFNELSFEYHSGREPEDIRTRSRQLVRVESLQNSPHLLCHVQTLRLYFWRPSVHGNSVQTLYDAVTTLLFTLPHVRTLKLHSCDFRNDMYSFILYNPLLTSLEIVGRTQDPESAIFSEERPAMRLTSLTYSPFLGILPIPQAPIPCLRLLEGCLTSLTSLTTTFVHISHMISLVGNRSIPLRHLTILQGASSGDECTATGTFLVSCTELRSLENHHRPDHDWSSVPRDALPKLESVKGSWNDLRSLVPGRRVHEISLLDEEFGDIKDIDCNALESIVPIKSLLVTRDTSLNRQIRHLEHAKPFNNLTRLFLRYAFLDNVIVRDLEDDRQAVINALSRWPQLRLCRMDHLYSQLDLDRERTTEEVRCPVAPKGDPGKRGHPALEEVQLLSRFTWIWYPGEGWACREFDSSLRVFS